jgi:adenine phosphoribosyltransferase
MEELKKVVREVPDFPKEGILFYDITTLLKDGKAFAKAVDALCTRYEGKQIDAVVAIEARGYIFGPAMAYRLGVGFIPMRKPGKLPAKTIQETYELEYGTDTIEMHEDAVETGQNVLVVDDLLATGGTAGAACRLVEKAGGRVVECCFLIELSFLNGRAKLGSREVFSLLKYDE